MDVDKISTKLSFTDYGANTQLRKKFKAYLSNNDLLGYKMNKYPQKVCVMLVMLMEDIINGCIKYIEKGTNGLYVLRAVFLNSVVGNYDFLAKYLSKYNKTNNYEENLLFNADKVYQGLEYRIGEKLSVDNDSKNFLNYLMVCVQYDFLKLSKSLLSFSDKKTFNNKLFLECLSFMINDELICKKIVLKIDSYNFDKKTDANNDADAEVEAEDDTVTVTVDEK